MAIHVMPTTLMSRWCTYHMFFGRLLRTIWPQCPYAAALLMAPLMLASCAELIEFRTDLANLRSDLQANAHALSQLSARLDALERRQADAESATRQTQQDLSQAIEVLLKKALVMEDRQSTRESARSQTTYPEPPQSQTHNLTVGPQGPPSQSGDFLPGKKQLNLGMTQDDVRHLVGEPSSIEPVGDYVFWHYSPMSNQQYIIFDKLSGQVTGWRSP